MSKSKSATLLPSAARTVTITPILLPDNFNSKKSNSVQERIDPSEISNIHLIIDVTAINLTPTITVSIEGLDEATGKYYTLIESAAITTVSTNTLKVGKNVIESTNISAQDFIPNNIRVSVVHTDADSITYSIGINYEVN